MAKPFEYGEDENESAVDRFNKRVARANERDDTDDDDDDSDDDDDDDDDDEPANARPGSVTVNDSGDEPVVSIREEKKAARKAKYAEDLEETRERLRRQELELAELRGRVSVTQRDGQRDATDDQNEDPFQAEIDAAEERQQNAWNTLQNKPAAQRTQADVDAYKKVVRETQAKTVALGVQRELARMGVQPGADPVRAARAARLQEEFADIYANQNALRYANGLYQAELAKGRPDSKATLDAVMASARKEFRLGGSNGGPPRKETRAKFEGQRSGSGGQAKSSGSDEGLTLRMTKPIRAMANARYAHIQDEQKRYEAFARSPAGRKLAKSLRDG